MENYDDDYDNDNQLFYHDIRMYRVRDPILFAKSLFVVIVVIVFFHCKFF